MDNEAPHRRPPPPRVPPAAADHTRVRGMPPHDPARDAAAYGLPESPACPFCAGRHTELHSPFGPQLSVATYWCRDCRTAFEFLKWRPPPERQP